MIAVAIEEALAALTAGSGEAAAASRLAGAGLNDLDKASGVASDALKNRFSQALKDANKTVANLSEAIKELQGGAKKYEGALTETVWATTAVAAAITAAIPGMQAVGIAALFAGKALGDYAAASLKQQDLLVKGYQSLSEFGAVDPSGLRGLLDSVKEVGAVPETMSYLLEAITQNSQQLAIFGGNVNDGGKAFTRVIGGLIKPGEEFERVLTNLGYSTEDITKYTASFISVNSKTIRGMTKDEEALKLQTNQYLETLTELSELTGVSRDQQQKAAQELQQEIQWRQYLRELAKQPDGARKVEQANAIMAVQLAKNGKEAVHAMQDMIVNGGATRASTAQLSGVYGRAVKEFKDGIKTNADTTTTVDRMNKSIAVGSNRYIDTFGRTFAIMEDGGKAMGGSYKLYDQATYSMEDNAKAVKENTDRIKSAGDSRLNEETKRRQAERVYANFYQELHFAVGNYAVPAITYFTKTLIAKAKLIDTGIPGFDASKEFRNYDNRDVDAIVAKEKANKVANTASQDFSRTTITPEEARALLKNGDLSDRDAKAFGGIDRLKEIAGLANTTATQANKTTEEARKLQQSNTNKKPLPVEIKPGALQPGTQLSPRLAEVAAEFKKMYPNSRVTGVNEPGVHRSGKHYNGTAMDIALEPGHRYNKDNKREVEEMTAVLKKLGATVRDETNKLNGPHLHIEIPDKPVELNGKKVSIATPEYKAEELKTASATDITNKQSSNTDRASVDNSVMVSKLDDLYTLFSRSLRVQEDILSHTKMLA